jgi:secreted Zn-dependent insulinase-like peptidase
LNKFLLPYTVQSTSSAAHFAELRALSLLHYQYLARKNAFLTVEEYGRSLFNENLATFPEHGMIPQTFDQAEYSQLLTSFSAENCAFILTADPALTKVVPEQREKWMGAEYSLRPITKEKLARWQTAAPPSTLCLAPENTFIPKRLTLLSPTSLASESSKGKRRRTPFLHARYFL